jgi:hypothetical protein
MTVETADASYCYDRVDYIIMLLIWLVLTNGNIPDIVASLICRRTCSKPLPQPRDAARQQGELKSG